MLYCRDVKVVLALARDATTVGVDNCIARLLNVLRSG